VQVFATFSFDYMIYCSIYAWQKYTNVDWLMVECPRDDSDRPRRRAQLTVKHGVLSLGHVSTQRRTTDLWRHCTAHVSVNLPSNHAH